MRQQSGSAGQRQHSRQGRGKVARASHPHFHSGSLTHACACFVLFPPQLLPCLAFVFLYSFLSHKELRFIYPVLPLLTCVAGVGLWKLEECLRVVRWQAAMAAAPRVPTALPRPDRQRARPADDTPLRIPLPLAQRRLANLPTLLVRAAHVAMLASLALSGLSLYVSSLNYPGGQAMHAFHQLYAASTAAATAASTAAAPSSAASAAAPAATSRPVVHVCNLAAMSGASRFLQHDEWLTYSKVEGVEASRLIAAQAFDFLIAERPADDTSGSNSDNKEARPPTIAGYELMQLPSSSSSSSSLPQPIVSAFTRLRFPLRSFPFFAVERAPVLWIMRRASATPAASAGQLNESQPPAENAPKADL